MPLILPPERFYTTKAGPKPTCRRDKLTSVVGWKRRHHKSAPHRLFLTRSGSEGCIAAIDTLIFAEGGEQSSRGASSFEQPTYGIRKALPLLSATPFQRPIMTARPRTNVGWLLLFGQIGCRIYVI
jgi:hypothetical protein